MFESAHRDYCCGSRCQSNRKKMPSLCAKWQDQQSNTRILQHARSNIHVRRQGCMYFSFTRLYSMNIIQLTSDFFSVDISWRTNSAIYRNLLKLRGHWFTVSIIISHYFFQLIIIILTSPNFSRKCQLSCPEFQSTERLRPFSFTISNITNQWNCEFVGLSRWHFQLPVK